MTYKELMNKIRYLDNLTAKWIMRHFYLLFFQIVLVIIFLFWLFNTIRIIDLNFQISEKSIIEQILITQSLNTSIIVLLILLLSFWTLYIFNSIQLLRTILKDINYHIAKLRMKNK